MTGDIADRVALITGANHGIGAAIARRLAADGIGVVITYLRIRDEVDAGIPQTYRDARSGDVATVVAAIEGAGGRVVAVERDLSDAGVIPELFDIAETELGPVDILINNATGWLADTFQPATTDRLGRTMQPVTAATHDAQFAVDARAAAVLIAEFARRHAARGATWGRIVGLSSGGPMGFPEEVSYGAAKAALENYTMSAALELADRGITANIVHPPVTDTGWVTDAVRDAVAGARELFHVATPDEVAGVIGWLCSDEAHLVTGNVLRLR